MGQFIRYCIVGAVNTVLDFGLYTILTRTFDFWRTHYLLANGLTFILVVTWSFFWNKRWTFKERSSKHTVQYTKFVAVTLGGIIISQTVLYIGVEWFSLHDLISKVIAGPLVVVWNFGMHRFWTFRRVSDMVQG